MIYLILVQAWTAVWWFTLEDLTVSLYLTRTQLSDLCLFPVNVPKDDFECSPYRYSFVFSSCGALVYVYGRVTPPPDKLAPVAPGVHC